MISCTLLIEIGKKEEKLGNNFVDVVISEEIQLVGDGFEFTDNIQTLTNVKIRHLKKIKEYYKKDGTFLRVKYEVPDKNDMAKVAGDVFSMRLKADENKSGFVFGGSNVGKVI